MPSDNYTSIVGNLVDDPELRFTGNGTAVANLRVAVAASQENDPTPVLTIAGQDYRAADAARTARLQAALVRHDPARAGAER